MQLHQPRHLALLLLLQVTARRQQFLLLVYAACWTFAAAPLTVPELFRLKQALAAALARVEPLAVGLQVAVLVAASGVRPVALASVQQAAHAHCLQV